MSFKLSKPRHRLTQLRKAVYLRKYITFGINAKPYITVALFLLGLRFDLEAQLHLNSRSLLNSAWQLRIHRNRPHRARCIGLSLVLAFFFLRKKAFLLSFSEPKALTFSDILGLLSIVSLVVMVLFVNKVICSCHLAVNSCKIRGRSS